MAERTYTVGEARKLAVQRISTDPLDSNAAEEKSWITAARSTILSLAAQVERLTAERDTQRKEMNRIIGIADDRYHRATAAEAERDAAMDVLRESRQFVSDAGSTEDDMEVVEHRSDLLARIDALLNKPTAATSPTSPPPHSDLPAEEDS